MRVCLVAAAVVALAVSVLAAGAPARGGEALSCDPAPRSPLRYPDVAPLFERRCNRCHDARQSDNAAAMRVFESSSYPFATERPDTLLSDLAKMFSSRGNLSRDEKCAGTTWIRGGALDAAGRRPVWRPSRR